MFSTEKQPRWWLPRHPAGPARPLELETWRAWFARTLIRLGAILFPLGSVFALSDYRSEGYPWLSFIDLSIWIILLVRAFSTSDAYKTDIIVIIATLYAMMITQFVTMGPDHARPLWLIVIAVIATFMFGVRGAVVTTASNIVILLTLYEFMGPGNKEWASEYRAPYYKWLVFVMDATLLTIMASLPIGYLLGRLDGSLKQEREAKQQLSKEGDRLRRTNEALSGEVERRRDTEKTLLEKEAYLRTLFEKAPDGYHLFDSEGRIVDINHATEKMLGFRKEELLGKRFYETQVLPAERIQDAISNFRMHMDGKISEPVEQVLLRKDGGSVPVEINAFPVKVGDKVHLLAIARDTTLRKRAEHERNLMERRLMQTQKMKALGTLAGGIAHDFNNILSAAIGHTELALADAGKETKLEYHLAAVLKAGTRARDLVQQILTFSYRESEQGARPVKVKTVAGEVLKLMRATLPATIDIKQHLESDASILAVPVQIHQLLMNLCTNAGQAMMKHGGVLEVRMTDVMPDAALLEKYPEMESGPHVEIVVTDTGQGITPEVIEKIFDPYFTTKGPGEGNGLGLSIVHGVVNKNQGALGVQSEPGRGTTFHIFLPATECETPVGSDQATQLPTGTEQILLVDDEPDIVEVETLMLEKLGYRVDASTSSAAAFDIFKINPGKYDLVMTDMTMPGATGKELALKMMEIRPDIPIVLCSGFSHQINKNEAMEIGIKAFIIKPLKLQELAHAIRKVLDETILNRHTSQ